jgi:hypothetical protein
VQRTAPNWQIVCRQGVIVQDVSPSRCPQRIPVSEHFTTEDGPFRGRKDRTGDFFHLILQINSHLLRTIKLLPVPSGIVRNPENK